VPIRKPTSQPTRRFHPIRHGFSPLLTSPTHWRRAARRRRGAEDVLQIPEVGDEDAAPAPLQNPPTEVLGSLPVIAGSSTGTPTATTPTDNVMTEAPDPALAKAKATQTSPCSTSPAKSMPPSASKPSKSPFVCGLPLRPGVRCYSVDILSVQAH
jgi:hypothetical protein